MSLFQAFFKTDVQQVPPKEFTPDTETANKPQLQRRSSKEIVGQDPYSEFVHGKDVYMKNVGRDMYDNVSPQKKEPSIWEEVKKSESFKARELDRIEDY